MLAGGDSAPLSTTECFSSTLQIVPLSPAPPPPGWVQGRAREPDSEPVPKEVVAHWGSRWSSQEKGRSALQSREREMVPAKNETVGAAGFKGKARAVREGCLEVTEGGMREAPRAWTEAKEVFSGWDLPLTGHPNGTLGQLDFPTGQGPALSPPRDCSWRGGGSGLSDKGAQRRPGLESRD